VGKITTVVTFLSNCC